MTSFLAFCLYLCLGCLLLVGVPILRHPSLPRGRKALLFGLLFLLLVPGALVIYSMLGAPMLASQ